MVKEVKLLDKILKLEVNKFANQANASSLVTLGETTVFVSVCLGKEKEDATFLPLICDYEEKLYAAGKIPGGFVKREGRPPDHAILISRLIDRPIRPLFEDGFINDIQIVAIPLSADQQNLPDILPIIGASTALLISDIPILHPIGAVRIGRIDNRFILNPTYEQLEKSDLDLIVAQNEAGKVFMIDVEAKEIPEDVIIEAIEFASPFIKDIIVAQLEIGESIGKEKIKVNLLKLDNEIEDKVNSLIEADLREILNKGLSKKEREKAIEECINKLLVNFDEKQGNIVKRSADKLLKKLTREMILKDKIRVDKRSCKDIREITCEVGIFPRVHGSALFTRGDTQIITITTLGASSEEQILDTLQEEIVTKRFMHQYNFLPYSVGEVGPIKGPSRRDIGHGQLAEKALKPVLPNNEDFPYTIRLVSEVLSSNGSTSMASVCAGSLSLMDCGVPIKEQVAGVALGLVKEDDKYVILNDIQGIEDAYGDMDFKIAGTRKGITAIQLDVKIKEGLSLDIIKEALLQGKEARMNILEKMNKVISHPRKNLSKYAPRVFKLEIPKDKIGEVIGPQGKVIKKIVEKTNAKIDIEKDGKVFIYSTDEEQGQYAVRMIESIAKEIKVGDVYLGRVTRIEDYGAFVEILPGVEEVYVPSKTGLLHVSEISHDYIKHPKDVLKIGDEILVKLIKIDELGRYQLSKKVLEKSPPRKYGRRTTG